MKSLLRGWPVLLVAILVPTRTAGHDVDVASVARLFLDQIGDARYVLSIVDRKVPPLLGIDGVLPSGCVPIPDDQAGVRVITGFAFDCEAPIAAHDVITLPWSLAGVVMLARWEDGTSTSSFFKGNGRSVVIPMSELQAESGSLARLAARYTALGGEHILLGIDHLFFLVGLLLLLQGAWALLSTVTAFTIAHSLTLGAAVLGWVPVDRAPVEAGIALSIVLLAREIVLAGRGATHLVHRSPWIVAFVFGLLHGLGFAGALNELGLRSSEVPAALFFFNVGVELGQVAFVSCVILCAATVSRMWSHAGTRLRPVLGYALGGMAVLWLFDRLPPLWGA